MEKIEPKKRTMSINKVPKEIKDHIIRVMTDIHVWSYIYSKKREMMEQT